MDEPGIRQLNAISGAQPIGRNRGQWRRDEGPVGINQVVVVMEVTAIEAVLFIEAVIDPRVVLAPVERIRLLKDCIVRCWRIGVSHPQLLHGAEDRCNSFPVSRQQAGWNHVAGETAGPDRGGLDTAIRIESRAHASTRCVRRISQDSVIGRANDPVWSPQAEGEITQPFCSRR